MTHPTNTGFTKPSLFRGFMKHFKVPRGFAKFLPWMLHKAPYLGALWSFLLEPFLEAFIHPLTWHYKKCADLQRSHAYQPWYPWVRGRESGWSSKSFLLLRTKWNVLICTENILFANPPPLPYLIPKKVIFWKLTPTAISPQWQCQMTNLTFLCRYVHFMQFLAINIYLYLAPSPTEMESWKHDFCENLYISGDT